MEVYGGPGGGVVEMMNISGGSADEHNFRFFLNVRVGRHLNRSGQGTDNENH
jgi:hypothetical protein